MDIVNEVPVQVQLLVVVNVARAQQGSQDGDCYLFSTSGFHGAVRPVTSVRKGEMIVWRVMPIDGNNAVTITGFGGPAVPAMVNPAPMKGTDPPRWSSFVTEDGHDVPYEMFFTFDGVPGEYAYKCRLTTVTPRSGDDARE